MRVLFLVHAFNSLTQRLYVELSRNGHEVSVEFDIHDRVAEEAVALFRPDVILAPYLKRAIPATIWSRHLCLIVHPGPAGDRGPCALDWAILRAVSSWGVTVLQANAQMDAGPVWASSSFPMRAASKSSLYRHEVTQAAVAAVREALGRIEAGVGPLSPALPDAGPGDSPLGWQPAISQVQRAIDWNHDGYATIIRKIRAADGFPGIEDTFFERPYRIFDAHVAIGFTGRPGEIIGKSMGAVCRTTYDGAVWIGQLRPTGEACHHFKQPAVLALGALVRDLPEIKEDAEAVQDEIRYEESGAVGYLHFPFYNGALSTSQCERLRHAYAVARSRPTRVIALMGGRDFWCNGMHLHCIEAAESAGEESWANINVIDDLAFDILTTDSHLTIAGLQGNAAAGGVFLALATDRVLAHSGVILNPHYRNMGNLYGSEYWTYLLPRRVGDQVARELIASRLPLGGPEAKSLGLIDECAACSRHFCEFVAQYANRLAQDSQFSLALKAKRARRKRDEGERELSRYRADELERMRMNFFGFDPSYHIARHRFVYQTPHAWTPLHLAHHRRSDISPSLHERRS